MQVQNLYLDFLPGDEQEVHEVLTYIQRSISLSQLHHIHIGQMHTVEAVDECHRLLEQCPKPVTPFDLRTYYDQSFKITLGTCQC